MPDSETKMPTIYSEPDPLLKHYYSADETSEDQILESLITNKPVVDFLSKHSKRHINSNHDDYPDFRNDLNLFLIKDLKNSKVSNIYIKNLDARISGIAKNLSNKYYKERNPEVVKISNRIYECFKKETRKDKTICLWSIKMSEILGLTEHRNLDVVVNQNYILFVDAPEEFKLLYFSPQKVQDWNLNRFEDRPLPGKHFISFAKAVFREIEGPVYKKDFLNSTCTLLGIFKNPVFNSIDTEIEGENGSSEVCYESVPAEQETNFLERESFFLTWQRVIKETNVSVRRSVILGLETEAYRILERFVSPKSIAQALEIDLETLRSISEKIPLTSKQIEERFNISDTAVRKNRSRFRKIFGLT